ncbi:hypothetical protein FGO68_gene15619 [Halteria grandinella]|uniref:NADP-dependent oxidoreductase domain-containing protein n=1 Tax=Halteria grandinella TaxID=5974 RepID=A0A8J8NLW7_HALGN|nr:hypothetical protein FGO68_gene15619 [Halteria grandinella]
MVDSPATSQPYLTFSNGTKFPAIGLGTFLSTEGDCKTVVKEAILNHGYRNIDTATIYENEEAIGEALQEVFAAGIKREDVTVTTKLWQTDKHDIEGALRLSLKKLKLDYIDLYLVHWMAPKMVWEDENPIKGPPIHKVWEELERLVDAGLIKNLGVSNCTIPILVDMWSYVRIKPVINQVELHPYFVQKDSVAFHKKLGVIVQAYAPLGSSAWSLRPEKLKDLNLLAEPVLVALAAKYGKSVGQIVLNWHLWRGHQIIPKTTKVARLAENIQVWDFKLTEEEYESISGLNQDARFFNPKAFAAYGWNNMPYFD